MRNVHRFGLCAVLAMSGLGGPYVAAQAILAEKQGASPTEGYGSSVAFAGDLNGDGFDDVIVGAPQFRVGTESRPGRAQVISGLTGVVLHEFVGAADQDDQGRSVAGAGDVNGDGFADVIVGAPGADLFGTNAGLARVHSGATGAALLTIAGDSPYDGLGGAVAGAGDVDGDGVADVIVGAPGDDPHGMSSGSARVVSGATGATLITITGAAAYELCGHAVAGAGDVDGDGHADVLVGLPGASHEGIHGGRVELVSGATGEVLLEWHGAADGDDFGWAVAGAGDVDGDGIADVAIGARLADAGGINAGAAYLYSGADGALLREHRGVSPGDLFGSSLFGAGDMNGDGRPELIVGAPNDHCDGTNCGAASVFSGATGNLLYVYHGAPNEQLGSSVGGGGDSDGDGNDDIIVGLPWASSIGGEGSGRMRLYSATAWLNLGLAASGGPGAQGSALFSAAGNLSPQQPFTLSLTGAPSLTPTMLVVGLSVLNAPFKGATMVPRPDFLFGAPFTNAAGDLALAGTWPHGMPPDLELTMQFWSVDPDAEHGLSASNALQAHTP